MDKPFSMIFFVAVMVWMGSIFVSSSPTERIERACEPVALMDKVVVAIVQLVHEPYAQGTHQFMEDFQYGCKFTVWKAFYESKK